MASLADMWILIGVLLVVVFSGVHIAVALGLTAALGIFLMNGDINTVGSFIGSTAYESLRDYVFAVIPLFMLMGEFLGKRGSQRCLRVDQPHDASHTRTAGDRHRACQRGVRVCHRRVDRGGRGVLAHRLPRDEKARL